MEIMKISNRQIAMMAFDRLRKEDKKDSALKLARCLLRGTSISPQISFNKAASSVSISSTPRLLIICCSILYARNFLEVSMFFRGLEPAAYNASATKSRRDFLLSLPFTNSINSRPLKSSKFLFKFTFISILCISHFYHHTFYYMYLLLINLSRRIQISNPYIG